MKTKSTNTENREEVASSSENKNNKISGREMDVLRHTALGKTRGEISTILGISNETVKAHIKKLYKKLNASSRAQLALHALRLGLVELEEKAEPPRPGALAGRRED